MPYIKQERRSEIIASLGSLFEDPQRVVIVHNIKTCGELNYAITEIIKHYFERDPNYQSFNDISGALTEALAEFRRRKGAAYEDQKIEENGDVY